MLSAMARTMAAAQHFRMVQVLRPVRAALASCRSTCDDTEMSLHDELDAS